MLDFGTTASHSNALEWTDADYGAALDALTKYTMLIPIRPRAAGWTGNRGILSKFTSTSGWTLRTQNNAGNNRIRMIHGSAGTTDNPGDNTTNLANGTTYKVIVWWDGSTFRYYIDGVSEGNVAFTKAIDANSVVASIGNEAALAVGAQAAIGPVVIWPNYALTTEEIAQANAGQILPAASIARFFHRGTVVPGFEEIERIEGTLQGSVALLVDPVDTFFPIARQIEDERLIATQMLVERAADEVGYQVRVPLHLAESMELMDTFNLSHDAALRSASHLGAFGTLIQENVQLMDKWRRGTYRLVGRSLDWMAREADLTFVEHEPAMFTYIASEKAPFGTADDYPGVARADVGGIATEGRTSKGYLEQENNQIVVGGEGNFIAVVGPNVSKVNHKGLLSEDAATNGVVNPVFASGLTSWTSATAGGGSVTAITDRKAFPSFVSGNAIRVIGAAASENSFRQTVAVLSAQSFRRFLLVHSDGQSTNPNWRIQRSSDNRYWNDGTGTWDVADTWNGTSPAGWDSTNNLEVARIFWSKPIPVNADENWEIRVGKINTATTHYFYCVNLTIGKLRYMPLVDTTASAADDRSSTLQVEQSELDATHPLANGLKAAYLFDEGEGGNGDTIKDVSGNGHDAIIVVSSGSPATWASGFGEHDPAFILDKSPIEIGARIPDHADFDFSGPFSIVLGYAARPAELAAFDTICGKASADAWNDGFTIATNQSAKVDWQFNATINAEGLQDQGFGETHYNDSDYHQLIVTFDPAVDTEILYVDGAEAETKTDATSAHTTNASDVYFGRQPNATHRAFSGYLFYAYFYNRVLSPAEVTSLYSSPYQAFVTDDQRQLLPVERFTVTVDLVALQDGADLVDGDQLVIWAAQVGDSGKDFYYLLYQKLAGQNVRFSFERWTDVSGTSTLDVRATRDVSIVHGQTYRITCRQVNDVTQELGLAPRTMRINVDGVNGVDVQAAALFSPFVRYSQLWGTPPTGSGFRRANNYLSYIRVQPRVITDEEWRSA